MYIYIYGDGNILNDGIFDYWKVGVGDPSDDQSWASGRWRLARGT